MRISVSGKLAGLGVGLLGGLVFLILGWRSFLILLAFAACGLVVGVWIDAGDRIKRWWLSLIQQILRS
jgi:uncharacterized membrane protein